MERHVLDLVEGMISHGHEVYVWCPEGVIAKDSETLGAQVQRIKIKLDIDPVYIFRLARFLKKHKIDIVHAHELKASTNAMIAGKLAGTKVRISHTHTPISEWQISPLKKNINLMVYPKIVNRFSTCEIALTESRKKIKIEEGVQEDRLCIVNPPNAIRVGDFTIEPEKREIHRQEILKRHNLDENVVLWGCLGRISEEKGHQVLMEAFGVYLNKLPEAEKNKQHLIFIGGGPLEEQFLNQAENLKIEKQFTITGRFMDEDKIKYYSTLDYFVHPSLAEGFGIVLIEAMTVGLPILASDLEVFKEVAGDAVYYFEKGNSERLSSLMENVRTKKSEAEEVKAKAQQRAIQNYSYEKYIESYHQFYLELQQK